MKVIICSDSHGNDEVMQRLQTKYELYPIIHCGDYCSNASDEGLIRVVGNCDSAMHPSSKMVEIDNLKILIVHGHLFNRHQLLDELFLEAHQQNCDIVCFGHIHQQVCVKKENVLLINPGSVSYNYDYSKPSYAILDTETLQVEFKVVEELYEKN